MNGPKLTSVIVSRFSLAMYDCRLVSTICKQQKWVLLEASLGASKTERVLQAKLECEGPRFPDTVPAFDQNA